jgi:hypothetical protein
MHLKNKIGHLKKQLERGGCEDRLMIHPNEKVQISCNREYMERAKQAFEEVGGKYTPSRSEVASKDFQTNLSALKKVRFQIGGFFNGFKEYEIEITDNEAFLIVHDICTISEKRAFDKEELLYNLGNMYIGEWLRHYDPKRFGCDVLDGTQWSVIFEYNNGHKPVEFSGSNDYPYNFDDFIEIFGLDYDEEIGVYDEEEDV